MLMPVAARRRTSRSTKIASRYSPQLCDRFIPAVTFAQFPGRFATHSYNFDRVSFQRVKYGYGQV